jgi:hypothetical protein
MVALNAEHFSAMLPAMQKNVPFGCLQLLSLLRLVGNCEEKCYNFSLLYVCFPALLPTTPIIFPRKIIKFEYLHELETICEFTLGFQSGA